MSKVCRCSVHSYSLYLAWFRINGKKIHDLRWRLREKYANLCYRNRRKQFSWPRRRRSLHFWFTIYILIWSRFFFKTRFQQGTLITHSLSFRQWWTLVVPRRIFNEWHGILVRRTYQLHRKRGPRFSCLNMRFRPTDSSYFTSSKSYWKHRKERFIVFKKFTSVVGRCLTSSCINANGQSNSFRISFRAAAEPILDLIKIKQA